MANRARIVIKRPLIHYFISLGYVLAPIVNILLLIFIARIRLPDILQRLFQGYGYLAGIWLLTAPLVGIGLYFVHKASWYLFLAHSALILVDYVLKWVTLPAYYWLSIRGVHQILLFTGNLALVAIVGYILQKDFRAPYFQVLPRGWRTSRRVPIRHYVHLDDRQCNVSDLSDTGCFVAEPQLGLELGQKVSIRFKADAMTIACRGEVMRRTPDGFGVRFMRLRLAQQQDIRRMIRKRFPFRYPVELRGKWIFDGRQLEGTVLDISRTGCYLQADVAGLQEGQRGLLELPLHRRQAQLPGTIVWLNPAELHGKPVGFGAHFDRSQRKLIKTIAELNRKKRGEK